ncbi:MULTISPECIES: sensor histidine kinase [Micromonospora]|uniref:histidine kinase n=1 Tax=Micromonospora solifontis TaxID=2487138 RepID=A0ABX9WGD8_9ACTN|nr:MULTISPECIES: histidine kinase [Micromonospora]NES15175.1 sensor histidine kinase [Micromonospora sp. PPF5-17B]NES36818.1 sensor histidine kinase [Micromonospora solifontis]NES56510.1 sensor histidine kinase [Micromonospora sp. PPF5-6]RNL99011.1 sensor histidine kinase [Micromonospora solifontis]
MSSAVVPDHPWLLPGSLAPTSRAIRRTPRDWVVDALAFLLAIGWVVLAFTDSVRPDPQFALNTGPSWLNEVDLVLGATAAAALWLRRRWPVGLAVATAPLVLFSVTASVALLIIVFTVLVHRPLPVAAALVGWHLLSSPLYVMLRPDPVLPFWATTVWTLLFIGAVVAWALFVRARRQLVLSLRDRADRAEAEQQLRVDQARQLERTRIAREMHDVLAHRISLLSLHAGALEFRPDAPPAEVAKAAGVIRASAHAALQDLREVIGVLRAEPAAGGAPERPQPTLGDVPALVAESRAAGVRVSVLDEVVDATAVPAAVGRSAYRIVQEGLTNARKHAPGAVVTVRLAGGPEAGLAVEIRNRWPVGGPGSPIPGTGTGLVGVAERVTLAGGRLEHGRDADGDFRLAAWLPWPAS